MRYSAIVDSDTLIIINSKTQEPADAVAVIPSHMPDLAMLVGMVPRDLASELARIAAWRAAGFNGAPDSKFDA